MSEDDPSIHPQFFCNSCYITAKTTASKHPGRPIKRNQYKWLPHSSDCTICTTVKRERPKKKSYGGRPSAIEQHIRSVASPLPSMKVTKAFDVEYQEEVHCIVCKLLVVKPVEVQPCKLLACDSCCIELISSKTPFDCPGCNMKHSCSIDSFSFVSPLAKKIICDLYVKCEKCHGKID